MKKLILMLLVLVGSVMQANADIVKVYFKPNTSTWASDNCNAFMIHSWGGSGGNYDVDFEYLTGGVYVAEFDTSKGSTGFQFVRKWGDWSYSTNRADIPTSHVFYDASSNSSWSLEGLGGTSPSSYGKDNPKTLVAGDVQITNGTGWVTDVTVTADKMTYNNDFTYSLDVNEHFALEGTYKFKIYRSDAGWCGDPNNSGKDFTVDLPKSGKYTLTYTYNILTGDVVVTPTLKAEATMTYKVEWVTSRTGTEAPYTYTWQELGTMSLVDGNPTLTYSPLLLTKDDNTSLLYKISWEAKINDETVASNWTHYNEGVDGHFTATPEFTGNHTITFIYYPHSATSSVTATYLGATNYYYIGGDGDWSVNQDYPLTANDGVYSITISNKGGHTFAILPDYAFSAATTIPDENWKYAIHPKIDNGNITVEFANNSGIIKIANCGNNWEVDKDYADYITFSFTPATNSWSVAPYFTRTIVNNNNSTTEGYATFSSDYNVTIPEGVTAFYASANSDNKVTMTKITGTSIGEGDGVFLAAAPGTYNFTPAAATDVIEGNLLKKPTGADGNTVPVGGYVLAKQNDNLGFYKVTTQLTNQKGKAYLELPSPAPMLSFDFGEGTTALNEVRSQMEEAREGIFDLQGRRVENPTKGLYIVNGKKVFIK